jgi:DNA topoisomerase I
MVVRSGISRARKSPSALARRSDNSPGIARVRSGKGFRYLRETGRTVKQPSALKRIRTLAIPPAWRDVWISPDADSPLQATGRDARGRKQYLYHADWRSEREDAKFGRLARFPKLLKKVRRAVRRDMALPIGSKRQVLATVVELLQSTHVRIGNSEYARQNGSFGLTTLKNGHAKVAGNEVQLRFAGKSNQQHDVSVENGRVARTVRLCKQLPGELFAWRDAAGKSHDVTSADVNAYLRDVSDADLTAKDLRTWAGTVMAVHYLRQRAAVAGATRQDISAVVRLVAEQLRNTPAVCRKSYIHPRVIAAFERNPRKSTSRKHDNWRRLSDEKLLSNILIRK